MSREALRTPSFQGGIHAVYHRQTYSSNFYTITKRCFYSNLCLYAPGGISWFAHRKIAILVSSHAHLAAGKPRQAAASIAAIGPCSRYEVMPVFDTKPFPTFATVDRF
jgi:hypothetical protein